MTLIRNLYDAGMFPLSALAAPLFALHPRGRLRLKERFGDWRLPPAEYLWFHGASLGEMQGLIPVIKIVKERYPAQRILVTSTSPTGLTAAEGLAHQLRLLPFDVAVWIRRALRDSTFRGFIFGETELWPALLAILAERKVCTCLVNARVSDSTASWYRRFRTLFQDGVRKLAVVCAGDSSSATRLQALGATNVVLCGNAKFDRTPLFSDSKVSTELRTMFVEGDEPILTLASLHPEEGEVWFPVLKTHAGSKLRVILAPRHSERFDQFSRDLTRLNIPFERRSELRNSGKACQSRVLLLDTFGELESVFSFSSAAFIGGTIRDVGGHNPLEAAMYGVALSAGPSRWNIKDIAKALIEVDALDTVNSSEAAAHFAQRLLTDVEGLRTQGQRGRAVWQANTGASQKIIKALHSVGVLPE